MTAPGSPVDPSEPILGRQIDRAMRHRLLEVLLAELQRSGAEALAAGVSPEQLSAQLDERIARLRAHLNDLHVKSAPTRPTRPIGCRIPAQRRPRW
ncbi:hypothetical protein F4553_003490 [Allocatelliglobosispora scoriae]|uniref:Uncharacterized protein n=1 Tax=Allocatelliglobosispora scoriae TaxID=643052 RepID=A0A841BTJ8_9ACTN|nr:hypothetical protein [Allocatelliglobosispora scoriae]